MILTLVILYLILLKIYQREYIKLTLQCYFLVATSILNYGEQVINETKIEVQSYESWLTNRKVNYLLIISYETLNSEVPTQTYVLKKGPSQKISNCKVVH